MHIGLHHAERRKREGTADRLDHIMLFVGSIAPLSLLPQVVTIWTQRDVSNISPASWILLGLVSCAWVVYGIVRGSKALIVSNAFFAALNFMVAIAYFAFR